MSVCMYVVIRVYLNLICHTMNHLYIIITCNHEYPNRRLTSKTYFKGVINLFRHFF